MPRFVTARHGRRLKTSVRADRSSVRRFRKGQWVDPFPGAVGSLPEKIVYAELSARNIPFLFRNELKFNIPELSFTEWREADIAIPSLKIIIEIQGSYWHSMPDRIEDDAFKFAVYEQTGWDPVAWWDYEILQDVHLLFASHPILSNYPRSSVKTSTSEMEPQRQRTASNTKGIVTMNRRRAQKLAYKRPAVRRRMQ